MNGLISAALAATLMFPFLARAQEFPVRPVQILVPLPPGGIATIFTRYIAEKLEARWKQSVVVDYRPGAGGVIGHEAVSRAAPDGYTLGICSDTASTFRLFVKGNNFDMEKDLAPVSLLVRSPFVLQSPSVLPARSIREFVAYAKANPGKLNVGVVPNSAAYLGVILFMKRAGIDLTPIPYNGGAPNLQALLANETQLYFGNYGTSVPHFQSGKLVPLAATSATRYYLAPDVPTLKESGIDFVTDFWFALCAPPKTPSAILDRVSGAVAEIMKAPEGVEKMKGIGLESIGSTPQELARLIAEQVAMSREAARLANIPAQ